MSKLEKQFAAAKRKMSDAAWDAAAVLCDKFKAANPDVPANDPRCRCETHALPILESMTAVAVTAAGFDSWQAMQDHIKA